MKEIVTLIAEYYKVPVMLVYSKNKSKNVCLARQVSMYIIRENSYLGWSDIGRHFGKNHATIMHSHKTVNDMMSIYPKFKEVIEFLLEYSAYIKIELPMPVCRPVIFKTPVVV